MSHCSRCGELDDNGNAVNQTSSSSCPGVQAVQDFYAPCPRCAELTADLDAARREVARLTGLVEQARAGILEHQWAIRMLTESSTPEALSLRKLKANGDVLLNALQREGLAPKEQTNGSR